MSFHVPNQFRLQTGRLASSDDAGNSGAFAVRSPIPQCVLFVIASDEFGWEHVSVSAQHGRLARTPFWAEMAAVKDLFWDDEDTVVQYHPPKSEYVNNYGCVLHLWRQVGFEFPLPPSILVGIKELGELPDFDRSA